MNTTMQNNIVENITVEKSSHSHEHHESHNVFGFWIYIMSDCALFAAIFATYIVLQNNTFGGPSAKELFSMPYVLGETMLLLTSSFTYGIAMLAAYKKNLKQVFIWLFVTFFLGIGFMIMEINEFAHLISTGNAWNANAYMSAFFTLVGTHGLHVSLGLVWLVVLLVQLKQHRLTPVTTTKLTCLGLFWHFLDIVWIFVFTIVYLSGAI